MPLRTPAALDTDETEVLVCPACNAEDWRDQGRIPPASEFAGQVLERALPGGRLLECRSCGLNWRSIVQPPAFYAYGRWLARKRGLVAAAPFHANPPGQGLTRDHMVAALRRAGPSPEQA